MKYDIYDIFQTAWIPIKFIETTLLKATTISNSIL